LRERLLVELQEQTLAFVSMVITGARRLLADALVIARAAPRINLLPHS
jgi:hypothetical protein